MGSFAERAQRSGLKNLRKLNPEMHGMTILDVFSGHDRIWKRIGIRGWGEISDASALYDIMDEDITRKLSVESEKKTSAFTSIRLISSANLYTLKKIIEAVDVKNSYVFLSSKMHFNIDGSFDLEVMIHVNATNDASLNKTIGRITSAASFHGYDLSILRNDVGLWHLVNSESVIFYENMSTEQLCNFLFEELTTNPKNQSPPSEWKTALPAVMLFFLFTILLNPVAGLVSAMIPVMLYIRNQFRYNKWWVKELDIRRKNRMKLLVEYG